MSQTLGKCEAEQAGRRFKSVKRFKKRILGQDFGKMEKLLAGKSY